MIVDREDKLAIGAVVAQHSEKKDSRMFQRKIVRQRPEGSANERTKDSFCGLEEVGAQVKHERKTKEIVVNKGSKGLA